MSAPKTLLQMAGADTTPSALSNAVLVLVDCQMEYVDGALALPGVGPALNEAGRVLERARAAGTPVFHIVHKGSAGGVFDLDGHGGQIAAQVAPQGDEPVIEKLLPNSFAGTDLDDKIRATGQKEIIIVGFMSHMCISSTARAALDLGYRATVVSNAVATRDLPSPDGGVVDAALLHKASMTALSDRFAMIAADGTDLPD